MPTVSDSVYLTPCYQPCLSLSDNEKSIFLAVAVPQTTHYLDASSNNTLVTSHDFTGQEFAWGSARWFFGPVWY